MFGSNKFDEEVAEEVKIIKGDLTSEKPPRYFVKQAQLYVRDLAGDEANKARENYSRGQDDLYGAAGNVALARKGLRSRIVSPSELRTGTYLSGQVDEIEGFLRDSYEGLRTIARGKPYSRCRNLATSIIPGLLERSLESITGAHYEVEVMLDVRDSETPDGSSFELFSEARSSLRDNGDTLSYSDWARSGINFLKGIEGLDKKEKGSRVAALRIWKSMKHYVGSAENFVGNDLSRSIRENLDKLLEDLDK